MEESNNETEKQYKIKVNPEKIGIDYIFDEQNKTLKVVVKLYLHLDKEFSCHGSQCSDGIECHSRYIAQEIFRSFCKFYLKSWDTFIYDLYNKKSINRVLDMAYKSVEFNIDPKTGPLSEFGAQSISLRLIK